MPRQLASNAAGGLVPFALAMLLRTEGSKTFARGPLKQLLGQRTSTPLRGLFFGMLVTGMVRSSSAVSVANIGTPSTAPLAMLPSANWLATLLEPLFRDAEQHLGRPGISMPPSYPPQNSRYRPSATSRSACAPW